MSLNEKFKFPNLIYVYIYAPFQLPIFSLPSN
jgi:hypothetical protein